MRLFFRTFAVIAVFTLSIFWCGISFSSELEIKGDYFYMDGKPFFIKGVGYSPWRPGQWPGADTVDMELIEYDLGMIKEAGFNTIRSWDALDEEVLKAAAGHGLYVIQGIWIDPKHNFADKLWQDQQIRMIESVVRYSKGHPNVLLYMVMTEPTTRAAVYAGEEETEEFFRRIVDAVRKIDKKPVTMDSWIPAGFLDHSMWDVVTFNAFMFSPESINRILGFEEYVALIKRRYAKEKPLIIGETGGFSVSPTKRGALGYGGNTEEEQSRGDINSIMTSFNAGAAGVCVVSWLDTWHYPEDPNTHDDHPWEWSGIIAIEDKAKPRGRPRMVYHNLKKFNAEFNPQVIKKRELPIDIELTIEPAKKVFSAKGAVEAYVKVARDGKPVVNGAIEYAFFIQEGWKESRGIVSTGADGQALLKCDLEIDGYTGYVLLCVSFKDARHKISDIEFLKVDPER